MSLLEVESLEVRYGRTLAVRDVSLALERSRTLAVVGESGSGKSTLVRAIVGMAKPSGGDIRLDGASVVRDEDRRRTGFHRRVQMVFQDPYSSLDPMMTIGDTLEEAVVMRERLAGGRPPGRAERRAEVARLLDEVALPQAAAGRRPQEFSGGQRQRIAIARALAMRPEVILADEITSALDVSVQAQILNLLRDIQAASGIALLFITHNLAVARYVCDDVMVMRHGAVVERGGVEVFDRPSDPYTRTLIAAVDWSAPRMES